MTYPRSAALIAVLDELEEMDARQNACSIRYNGVNANTAGDSSGAENRIDSTIAPADQLSPGSVGVSRNIEGIVR
jgi:hypothetical protein